MSIRMYGMELSKESRLKIYTNKVLQILLLSELPEFPTTELMEMYIQRDHGVVSVESENDLFIFGEQQKLYAAALELCIRRYKPLYTKKKCPIIQNQEITKPIFLSIMTEIYLRGMAETIRQYGCIETYIYTEGYCAMCKLRYGSPQFTLCKECSARTAVLKTRDGKVAMETCFLEAARRLDDVLVFTSGEKLADVEARVAVANQSEKDALSRIARKEIESGHMPANNQLIYQNMISSESEMFDVPMELYEHMLINLYILKVIATKRGITALSLGDYPTVPETIRRGSYDATFASAKYGTIRSRSRALPFPFVPQVEEALLNPFYFKYYMIAEPAIAFTDERIRYAGIKQLPVVGARRCLNDLEDLERRSILTFEHLDFLKIMYDEICCAPMTQCRYSATNSLFADMMIVVQKIVAYLSYMVRAQSDILAVTIFTRMTRSQLHILTDVHERLIGKRPMNHPMPTSEPDTPHDKLLYDAACTNDPIQRILILEPIMQYLRHFVRYV